MNTARSPNIKHNSPKVKDTCYFAERVRYMLDIKKNHPNIENIYLESIEHHCKFSQPQVHKAAILQSLQEMLAETKARK